MKDCTWLEKWSRSHGTALNCSRWVASCRHTHIWNSSAGTSNVWLTLTTFGATSSSRPGSSDGPPNGSYCPSTREARKASATPTCMPVVVASTRAGPPLRNPVVGQQPGQTFGRRIHPSGSVDDVGGARRKASSSPVSFRTCFSAITDMARIWRTAAAASSTGSARPGW